MTKKSRKHGRKEGAAPHNVRPAPGSLTKPVLWTSLAIVLLSAILIRIRLLPFPFERDEGAFSYMAQLLLDGVAPYTRAFDFKPPWLYAMYALFITLFGETISGVHFGLLLMNAASILLLFLIAKRILNNISALAAVGAYAFLSLGPSVYGFAAHATQFVVLPALGGVLLLLKYLERPKLSLLFWCGVLLSISFFMKQPAIFFIALGFFVIASEFLRARPIQWKQYITANLVTGAGVLVPVVITTLYLAVTGALQQFWFWCFVYTSKYGTQLPFSRGIEVFQGTIPHIIDGYALLWALAGAGIFGALFFKPLQRYRWFILLFAAMSFAAVCPGWFFREHYFIVLLPALGLLTGVATQYLGDLLYFGAGRRGLYFVPAVLVIIGIAIGLNSRKDYYFTDSPTKLSRTTYGANPFPEAVEIARYIEKQTTPADKIAIFGSEPEIYFYTKRRSASNYIFTYPMVEYHEFAVSMQQEMIDSVSANKPAYMVFVSIGSSWLVGKDSERRIFNWLDEYSRLHYQVEGIVELRPNAPSQYYWGEQARTHPLQSDGFLIIYKRITT